MLQLECERLLEDHYIDALTELRPQQRLTQRQSALGGGGRGDQRSFEHHENDDTLSVLPGPDGSDDRIDDQRAHVGNGGRQHAGHDGQQRDRKSQSSVGAPDQLDCSPTVAKDGEELLQRRALAGQSTARAARALTAARLRLVMRTVRTGWPARAPCSGVDLGMRDAHGLNCAVSVTRQQCLGRCRSQPLPRREWPRSGCARCSPGESW